MLIDSTGEISASVRMSRYYIDSVTSKCAQRAGYFGILFVGLYCLIVYFECRLCTRLKSTLVYTLKKTTIQRITLVTAAECYKSVYVITRIYIRIYIHMYVTNSCTSLILSIRNYGAYL